MHALGKRHASEAQCFEICFNKPFEHINSSAQSELFIVEVPQSVILKELS